MHSTSPPTAVATAPPDRVAPKAQLIDEGHAADYAPEIYQCQQVATGINSFADIDEQALAHFREQGYLVVHQAFDTHAVQGALAGLLSLLRGDDPTFTGIMYEKRAELAGIEQLSAEERQDYVRKFMWFVKHDQRLAAMAYHLPMLDLITTLISDEPALYQDMALIKPPRIGREKPWHQDHAYFDLPLTATVVGVWIALDEATVDNGCMVIYPGSHLQGPVLHFQRRDWQICDTHERPDGPMAVPLKPGGALFFHSLLQHGTPANTSPYRRRAVQFHYAPANAKQTAKEERLAIFGSEGKDVSC